ncbi:MAG: glycosyltransferase family 2 protein, partial [Ruminococcus sp.]|nr:glycosyltransferase family 2 protein [Ruminococcus sp.]
MKARVSNNTEKNNEIVLSIGMIVKNEEKHLENCLSALKNLTDYISSELIIVDTGSTDRTKEIALKYTDKVYDFEWIDDFAAARNYGLKKAKGKWFMFLDADEYFDEDCSQMIKFFSYPELYEQGKWNCGSVSMYNYDTEKGKSYSLFCPLRLARLTNELIFEGKIHEYLENIKFPIADFDTVVHHYGYVSNNSNIKNKSDRNMQLLLEEFKSKPNNVRLVTQLYD